MELKEISLFKAFTPEELERFKPLLKETDYKSGTYLFKEGDSGDCLYIVKSGSIRILKAINQNEEKSLALLEPGAYLGEMTLLDGTPRSAGARAEGDSVVICIAREDFLLLLRSYPQAAARLFVSFMKELSQRLREADDELVVLYEVGKIIGASLPLPEFLKALLERVMAGTKARFGAFFSINDITDKLEVKEAIGKGFENILDLKTGMYEGIVGLAIKRNEIIKADDLESDAELSALKKFGYERKRLMAAPLCRKDTPFGVIYVADPEGDRPFTNANLNLLHAVSSQAAAAVEASLLKSDAESKQKFDRHFFRF